jgi:translation initiation factor 1
VPDERRVVYSTDGSLPLPPPKRRHAAAPRGAAVPADGIVRVGCERRRGGTVSLVYGLAAAEAARVAAELKRRCGTGGTVKAGIVELQGDRRDAVLAYFAEHGRRAKRMGG